MIIGLLYAFGVNFGPVIRWRLRQDKGLEGSMLMDVLLHTFLPCCALIQDAQEFGWNVPDAVGNSAKRDQEMSRE